MWHLLSSLKTELFCENKAHSGNKAEQTRRIYKGVQVLINGWLKSCDAIQTFGFHDVLHPCRKSKKNRDSLPQLVQLGFKLWKGAPGFFPSMQFFFFLKAYPKWNPSLNSSFFISCSRPGPDGRRIQRTSVIEWLKPLRPRQGWAG